MDSYEFWENKGKSLGFSGEALFNFIEKREHEVAERDERATKREQDKIKAETELLAIQAKEREKERAHELRVLELSGSGGSGNPEIRVIPAETIKPPYFKDGDDLVAYLDRFERIATLYKWDKELWPAKLGSLLQGRALEIYYSIDMDVSANFDLLKAALLRGFKKTSDSYRKDFRSARIDSKSTYEQFMNSLSKLFTYWYRSLELYETYENLRDLVVMDQFMSTVSKELRVFLKERKPKSREEMACLADTYASAHGTYPKDFNKTRVGNPVPNLENKFSVKSDGKPNNQTKQGVSKIKCYSCGQPGHITSNCPNKPKPHENKIEIGNVLDDKTTKGPMTSGTVNGTWVSTILRDTGCSGLIISDILVPQPKGNVKMSKLTDYLGRVDEFPVVRVYLRCPWFTGWCNAVRAPIKYCSVLLGNIPGVANLAQIESADVNSHEINAVTRSQSKSTSRNTKHPKFCVDVANLNISHSDFKTEQQQCNSLCNIREYCKNDEVFTSKNGLQYKYLEVDGLIYRKILACNNKKLLNKVCLVVPKKFVNLVLQLSHDIPIAGHFSHRKTFVKINELFYWQGMTKDIYNYCKSCDRCQKTTSHGRVKKAPLVKLPVISTPFYKVAIDIVGPIKPMSSEGHQYILTLIDYASGFPDAVPLKSITSVDIAEALVTIFSRVGIPREILSDRGPQFKSELMDQVHALLGVRPLFTTPYHPAANGKIERQHSVLKSILKKLCSLKPNLWHKFIPAALFSMREIPSDSSGFSPFEILYGRQVRGPLSILLDVWSNKNLDDEETNLYRFVIELRERLAETTDLVSSNMNISMDKYKSYFDVKTSKRNLNTGDEVLLLIPDSFNKFQIAWTGPHKVVRRIGPVDYLINVNGKEKLYHINLLKKYFRRSDIACNFVGDLNEDFTKVSNFKHYVNKVSLITDEDDELLNVPKGGIITLDSCRSTVNIGPCLNSKQVEDVNTLLEEFDGTFSDIPGKTSAIEHHISVQSKEPFQRKSYPIPVHLKAAFENEVRSLLNHNIIEPSNSSEIIDILHDSGFTSSYDEVRRFRKSAALLAGNDNFQIEGLLNEGVLVSTWCDNFDLSIHPKWYHEKHIPWQSLFNMVEMLHDIPSRNSKNIQRSSSAPSTVQQVSQAVPFQRQQKASSKDNTAVWTSNSDEDDPPPEWAGAMVQSCRMEGMPDGPASQSIFGPLIDMPPSHPDTVLTTLMFIEKSLKNRVYPFVC
ncbi:uncharacterized protein [Macrobrachium rosenbergii]|uniref:uncharacterized protein n=1 Tax=Macrobrachium rosenbergii TaxID=79674 RepID=UPI0034D77802